MPSFPFDHLAVPALLVDAAGRVAAINPALSALLPGDGAIAGGGLPGDAAAQAALRDAGTEPSEARLALDPARGDAPFLISRSPLPDGGALLLLVPLAADRAELARRAATDALTGLANRGHFFALAAKELARAARRGGTTALLLADIDGLKQVNDRLGHPGGDALLAWFGAHLAGLLRAGDLAGRIGGDEFAILLPDTDRAAARALGGRLLGSLEGAAVPVRLSIGVDAGAGDVRIEDLYAGADRRLYDAKKDGGHVIRD